MEVKYAAMFASVQAGKESVTELCARLGISRRSYYKYLARFMSEGLDGLQPRSRRPLRSPTATPPEMVELITTARAVLASEGWDNGALSIFYRLLREGEQPPRRGPFIGFWCVSGWWSRSRRSGHGPRITPLSSPPPMIAGRSTRLITCWLVGAGWSLRSKMTASQNPGRESGLDCRGRYGCLGVPGPRDGRFRANLICCCRITRWRSAARLHHESCWWRRT